MIDYNHPQLNPAFNRTRGPAASPVLPEGPAIQYPRVDPEAPYRNTFLGLFNDPLTDEKGLERPTCLYIPTTEKSAWNMVLVLVPGGKDPQAFFEENGWKDLLEQNCMTALFLGAPNGWNKEEPGYELDAAVKGLALLRSNRYFQSNAPAIYCAGFGDGAWVASLLAVTHTSVLAAWSAMGSTALDDKLLQLLADGPSDCDAATARKELPLPCCIFDNEESNTVQFFKAACRTKEEGLRNDYAKVYRQQEKGGESYVNDPARAEVWHGTEDAANEMGIAKAAEIMITFMEGYKRWSGEANGHIRSTIRMDAIGMKRTDVVVDGLKRYWITFEPTAYKKNRQEKYPLVIAIHGFTCHSEFFAGNSGWNNVGEERGAIVVYPTAYPFTSSNGPMGNRIATHRWNSGGMGAPEAEGPNELNYFKVLIDTICKEYPIDTTRIYVTGHSNGAMMTQYLMRAMPSVFAGFAPVGFMENIRGGMEPEPDDGIARNVWYVMGQYDGGGCELIEGNANVSTIRMLCDHNKAPYEGRRYYESGIYMHSIFRDQDHVPMVRFTGIKNWPHTYTPEVAFMLYDEFFARFVRHEDGTLEYLT